MSMAEGEFGDGPFGIASREGGSLEDATFYIKPGRTPSPEQSELLFRVLELIARIRGAAISEPSRSEYVSEIVGAFSAGSVASDKPALVKHTIAAIETRFADAHLVGLAKLQIRNSLLILGAVGLLAVLASYFVRYLDSLSHAETFLFLAIGVIAGRFISTAILSAERIKSFAEFELIQRGTSSPLVSASVDLVIAFVAVVFFSAGFIVISFAESPPSDASNGVVSGLSTRMIDQDPRIAVGFGILIGVARSRFLDRVKSLANNW